MVPASTRRLLGVGLILGFTVALPLFVWVVAGQKFNFNPNKKASDIQRVAVSVDDDPSVGPADAPITIVEFGDFQCDFCKQFQDETFQPLMDAYPNQIRYVLRDFPITDLHPLAETAAEAADCAGSMGKYWEMHDVIFTNQIDLSVENLKTWAGQLNLDTTQFNSCLDTSQFATEIQHDKDDGLSYGVGGTPTFFINGLVLEGSQPLSAFQQIIDSELIPASSTPTPTESAQTESEFDPSKITFAITTTDRSPNLSIAPSELLTGKTYNVSASFSLSGTSTPVVKFLINDTEIGQVQTQVGAANIITGSFVPTETTNKYILLISDNNKYSVDIGPNALPNSCNGTCGSNYNCGSGLFCSKGFCRNPSCPGDLTCGCKTPTPRPTLRATPHPSKTPEIVVLPAGGINRITITPTPAYSPTSSPTPTPQVRAYTDYIVLGGAGILILGLIILAVKLLRKSQEPPRFFPPTS